MTEFTMNARDFYAVAARVRLAADRSARPDFPALSHVAFTLTEGMLTAVGSDRYRLFGDAAEVEQSTTPGRFLMHARDIEALKRLGLARQSGLVHVSADGRTVSVRCDDLAAEFTASADASDFPALGRMLDSAIAYSEDPEHTAAPGTFNASLLADLDKAARVLPRQRLPLSLHVVRERGFDKLVATLPGTLFYALVMGERTDKGADPEGGRALAKRADLASDAL